VPAARELRDCWLEHLNAGGTQLIGEAKYEVSRSLGGESMQALPGQILALPSPSANAA
jgi:hypothetical protein